MVKETSIRILAYFPAQLNADFFPFKTWVSLEHYLILNVKLNARMILLANFLFESICDIDSKLVALFHTSRP